MNILIVIGHPRTNSYSHMVAERYKKGVEAFKHNVKIIDIYSNEYMLPYMTFVKDSLPKEDLKKIKKMQDMIAWADEVVIAHPIWWGSVPAGLKNWMDAVFCPNFAYKYDEKGKPHPLLTGKIAKIFATAGSYAPYYKIPIIKEITPVNLIWKHMILGYCGIDVIQTIIQDKMNINNNHPPEGCLEKFLDKVEHSAKRH